MTRVASAEPKAKGIVTITDKDGNVKAELEITSVESKQARPKETSEEINNAANDNRRRNSGDA